MSIRMIGILCVVIIGMIVASNVANAVSNTAPDQSDFLGIADTNQAELLVASGSLDAQQSTVNIYSTASNPTVTIYGYKHCFNTSMSGGTVDSSRPPMFRGIPYDTTLQFFSGGIVQSPPVSNPLVPIGSYKNTLESDPNATDPGSTCNTDALTLSFNLDSLSKMPVSSGLSGYYRIQLVATLEDNAYNDKDNHIVPHPS